MPLISFTSMIWKTNLDHLAKHWPSLSMSIGGLTQAELAKLAQEQVNEDPDRIVDDIQMVKKWLENLIHVL